MHTSPSKQRLLTLAGGGWVLVISGLVSLLLVVWAVAPAIMRSMNPPPGDGENIDSYGFDLSNLQVKRELVAPAMRHRDMAPAITNPSISSPDPTHGDDRWESMQRRNDPKYGKYLVSNDRIIGVEVNGHARAYPIHVMYVHEIINDTLGDVPIAVTYNWPCDSTVVLDRRVKGSALEFGVSGLVYNSNLLMYDRQPGIGAETQTSPGAESLWSQLLGRAVSGPAAATQHVLDVLPVTITTWGRWSTMHPNTTVLDRDLKLAARYKDAAPIAYFQSEQILFPVNPLPSPDDPAARTPVIVISIGDVRRAYSVPRLIEAHQDGEAMAFPFDADAASQSVWRLRDSSLTEPVEIIYAFWFAWHAMFPEDALVE